MGPENYLLIGVISGAFSAGGAWVGAQFRIKALERKVDRLGRVQGTLVNRVIRLITAHNRNHGDDIDSNSIEG